MRTIELHGRLGDEFGRSFRLDVKTPAEGIRALCSQLKGLKTFFTNSEEAGIRYRVMVGDRDIGLEGLRNIQSKGTFHIVPVMRGAKSGWVQALAGIALMVGSFFVPVPGLNAAMFNAGLALSVGGVYQLLCPTTKTSTDSDSDDKESNNFGSAVNTTAQGNPVPVLYGQREIGGAIVSAGIYTEDKY